MTGERGRPLADNAKTTSLFVRMTEEEKQAIKDAADDMGIGMATMTRILVKEALRARQAQK